MRLAPVTALLVGSLFAAASQGAAQERAFRVEPIADGVYLVASNSLGDPNVVFVTGPDRLVLVDGTFGEAADGLLAAVRETSALPLGDVVLTHWHPDHTQSNAAFRAEGATVWSHENAQRRMREGSAIEYFGLEIPPFPAEALADRTIMEAHTLRAGDHELRLIPLAPAHTDGDVLVHLPRANVLHLGDLQLGGVYPFVELSSGGDVDGLIAALDQALALADDSTVVVPGHGPIGGRAELAAYRDLLATVWARVRTGVADGKSLDEVIATAPAADFDAQWNTPLIPTDRFVEILYKAAGKGGSSSTDFPPAATYTGTWVAVDDAEDRGTSEWRIDDDGTVTGTDVDPGRGTSFRVEGTIDADGNLTSVSTPADGSDAASLSGVLRPSDPGSGLTGTLVWGTEPPISYTYTFTRQ